MEAQQRKVSVVKSRVFEYKTSTNDPFYSGKVSIKAGVDVTFDVTIPSGKEANMDQSPVELENLTNNGILNNSNATINQNFINTGTLNGLSGSVIGNFSNSGSTTISSSFSVNGSFNNTGTIIFSQNSSLGRNMTTVNNGPFILDGASLFLPNGLTDNGGISGYGELRTSATLQQGAIANVAGRSLKLGKRFSDPSSAIFNNSGTLQALNGGILIIGPATINGGSVNAAGGSVEASFATFNQVSLAGNNSHDFRVASSTLNNCNNTTDLNIVAVTLDGGSFTNSGDVFVQQASHGSHHIYIPNSLNITGGGNITIDNNTIRSSSQAVQITTDNKISGSGTLDVNIDTSQRISANDTGKVLKIKQTIDNGDAIVA